MTYELMPEEMKKLPHYEIFIDLITHPVFAVRQDEALAVADFLYQRGCRSEKEIQAQLAKVQKHKLDSPELMERAKEIVLEIRQYLSNTEFAPEPFTQPVDEDKLVVEFPEQILALVPKLDRPDREKIDALLSEPVTCEDGSSHYIDESNRRYVTAQLQALFELPEKPPDEERKTLLQVHAQLKYYLKLHPVSGLWDDIEGYCQSLEGELSSTGHLE